MESPVTLYSCSCGRLAPTEQLFYARVYSKLHCRHPACSLEECSQFYCPSCQYRTTYARGIQMDQQQCCPHCAVCPCCGVTLKSTAEAGSGAPYHCENCGWSTAVAATLPSGGGIEQPLSVPSSIQRLHAMLLLSADTGRSATSFASKIGGTRRRHPVTRWTWNNVEEAQAHTASCRAAASSKPFPPIPFNLPTHWQRQEALDAGAGEGSSGSGSPWVSAVAVERQHDAAWQELLVNAEACVVEEVLGDADAEMSEGGDSTMEGAEGHRHSDPVIGGSSDPSLQDSINRLQLGVPLLSIASQCLQWPNQRWTQASAVVAAPQRLLSIPYVYGRKLSLPLSQLLRQKLNPTGSSRGSQEAKEGDGSSGGNNKGFSDAMCRLSDLYSYLQSGAKPLTSLTMIRFAKHKVEEDAIKLASEALPTLTLASVLASSSVEGQPHRQLLLGFSSKKTNPFQFRVEGGSLTSKAADHIRTAFALALHWRHGYVPLHCSLNDPLSPRGLGEQLRRLQEQLQQTMAPPLAPLTGTFTYNTPLDLPRIVSVLQPSEPVSVLIPGINLEVAPSLRKYFVSSFDVASYNREVLGSLGGIDAIVGITESMSTTIESNGFFLCTAKPSGTGSAPDGEESKAEPSDAVQPEAIAIVTHCHMEPVQQFEQRSDAKQGKHKEAVSYSAVTLLPSSMALHV